MGEHGVYAGLRILELGAGAAGAVATRYFAEQGATVVRVESAARPDPLRLAHARGDEPVDLDASPAFALLNPDKWSVALDLERPEAVALALRLAEWADVVTQTGAMEALGLGPAQLLERKPGLIVVTHSLFGANAPDRDDAGARAAALAGFDHLTGWPDREPNGSCADALSARFAAVAIAAALLERGESGRGQHIDVSQLDAGVYALSEWIVRASANGERLARAGNRQAGAAPHGVYPCEGDGAWIAIGVFDDAAWNALVEAIGSPEWAHDARFVTALGREAHQGEIDAALATWTREQSAYAAMAKLQEHGVAAGVVQGYRQLLRDPQLAHRRHFATLDHGALGPLPYERSGFRLSASPGGFDDSGPLLGEDDDLVLGEILGLSEEEIARLVAAGVVG